MSIAPKSGPEMMLKMLGLGDMGAQIKALVDTGALQRIVDFSEQVSEINARLIRIEGLLIRARNDEARNCTDIIASVWPHASDKLTSGEIGGDD